MPDYYAIDPGASPSDSTQMQALHDHFDGTSSLWQIKAGTALNSGADGFVLEKAGGGAPNIAFRRGGGTAGGTMLSGGAVAGSGLFVGCDPGGGITDISSGSFAAGARWSGWAGSWAISTAASRGRIKILEDTDLIFIRQRNDPTEAEYKYGVFVGNGFYPTTNTATGYVLLTEQIVRWAADNFDPADVRVYEAEAGDWQPALCLNSVTDGIALAHQQDGEGNFRFARWGLQSYTGTSESQSTLVGVLKHLFTSAVQTEGTYWRDGGGDVQAVHIYDALIVADDGTVAE